MGRNPPEREEVYAVIRIDHFHSPDTPIDNKITVKEIVRDRRTAEAEVARLNAVNSDKNCTYFCQMTRLFATGESFGTHSVGNTTSWRHRSHNSAWWQSAAHRRFGIQTPSGLLQCPVVLSWLHRLGAGTTLPTVVL